MKKIILLVVLGLCVSSSTALANKPSRIELNDGSVIIGEVTNVDNGIYTISSEEIGALQINEQNIKQIGFSDSTANSQTTPIQPEEVAGGIDAMRNKLMGDKESLGMIMSLKDDPQFQEILKDPNIINAVKSGNTAALMNNDKFMQLKDNPIVQKIKDRATE